MKPLKQPRPNPNLDTPVIIKTASPESVSIATPEVHSSETVLPIETVSSELMSISPQVLHTNLTSTVEIFDTANPQTIHLSVFDGVKGFVLYPSQRALIPIREVFDYGVTVTTDTATAFNKGLCVLGTPVFNANQAITIPIINLSKEKQVIYNSMVIATTI